MDVACITVSDSGPQAGGETRDDFDRLVLRYQDRVYNLALKMLGDPDRALDVTQEAFVKALVGLRRFRGDSSFYTWIYRITVNLCHSESRRQRVRSRIRALADIFDVESDPAHDTAVDRTVPDPSHGPEESMVSRERAAMIQRCVRQLDRELKEVIVLRDMENLSYDQIAATLEIPIGTVRSRLHRARGVLRERLREWLPE